MTLLEAHELFARRTTRDAFNFVVMLPDPDRTDAWPAACVAACRLAGGLGNARDDEDLDELLKHFESLLDMGVKDGIDLERETLVVVDEIIEWGELVEEMIGAAAPAACDRQHVGYN